MYKIIFASAAIVATVSLLPLPVVVAHTFFADRNYLKFYQKAAAPTVLLTGAQLPGDTASQYEILPPRIKGGTELDTDSVWVLPLGPPPPSQVATGGETLITGTPKVYVFEYGTITQAENTLLTTFLSWLSTSNRLKVLQEYTGTSVPATAFTPPTIVLPQALQNTNPFTDAGVRSVISNAITTGTGTTAVPTDANAIYIFIAGTDIDIAGFCTTWCGYHSFFNFNGVDLKYIVLGHFSRCLPSCAPRYTSVNSNPGWDGMMDALAAIIPGVITNPKFNGWSDSNKYEIGSKCRFKYSKVMNEQNGAEWNVQVGTTKFLIQNYWSNSKKKCVSQP